MAWLRRVLVAHELSLFPQMHLLLQQDYPSPYQQVWAVVILAVFGGYVGCLFTSFNTWICIVRKRWSKIMWARIAEVRVGAL